MGYQSAVAENEVLSFPTGFGGHAYKGMFH